VQAIAELGFASRGERRMSELPTNWKHILRRCNFFLARRELSNFFAFVNKQGEAEGGQYSYPIEFGNLWERFANNPCYDTAVEFLEHGQSLFGYFEGSCPGGQFYRTGIIQTVKRFEIGRYKLGMHTRDIVDLRELSREEYAIFQRQFKDEAIYHAPPTQFLGRLWNMQIGVIGERLWKLAASLEIEDQQNMVSLVHSAYVNCETRLGTPTEEEQGFQMWGKNDGNVILQVASVLDTYDVTLFVTDGDAVRSAGRT